MIIHPRLRFGLVSPAPRTGRIQLPPTHRSSGQSNDPIRSQARAEILSRKLAMTSLALGHGSFELKMQLLPLPSCQRTETAPAGPKPAIAGGRNRRALDRSRCTLSSAATRTQCHRNCGDDRDRTGNLRLAKPALSQLSYVPSRSSALSGVLKADGCPRSGRTWIRTKDLSFIRAAL